MYRCKTCKLRSESKRTPPEKCKCEPYDPEEIATIHIYQNGVILCTEKPPTEHMLKEAKFIRSPWGSTCIRCREAYKKVLEATATAD